MIETDVIIVGGGPAGSTCAWMLIQAGIGAVVLDREPFPRTKVCAGWITPQVLADLQMSVGSYPHTLTSYRSLHVSLFGVRLP
ncbi:MAG: FAD-dependent oxidoreductase, partial [Smithellaceae bacterium]|nr:FAD-dependent oxidoreductase [Smithellaceae bacterium]